MKILMLHGQSRTSNAMRLLGLRLRWLGHEVQYFEYYTCREKFVDIKVRLIQTIQESFPQDQSYIIAGHSMGGLLARASLPSLEAHLPLHLVLLASARSRIYRRITTDCGQRVADPEFYKSLPRPTVPTTIIAGSGGPRSKWLPYGYEANDGAMSVQETSLGLEVEVIQVPSIHTFIMNSQKTLNHIDRIIQQIH
jgi:hypothetical protein